MSSVKVGRRKVPQPPTHPAITVSTGTADKICYSDYSPVELLKEIVNLKTENRQLRSIIRPLIHMKHMLLFWKYKFNEQEPPSEQFNSDIDLCLKSLLKETALSKWFEFVRHQELCYGSHQTYCDYKLVSSKLNQPIVPQESLGRKIQIRKIRLFKPAQLRNVKSAAANSGSRISSQPVKRRLESKAEEPDELNIELIEETKKPRKAIQQVTISAHNTEHDYAMVEAKATQQSTIPPLNTKSTVSKASQQVQPTTSNKPTTKITGPLKTMIKPQPAKKSFQRCVRLERLRIPLEIKPMTTIQLSNDEAQAKPSGQVIQTNNYTVTVGFTYKTSFNISLFYETLPVHAGESAFEHRCLVPECEYRGTFHPVKSHILEHLALLPFQCYSCSFSTSHVSSLLAHMKCTHRTSLDITLFNHRDFFLTSEHGPRYRCALGSCKFNTDSSTSLSEHITYHLELSPFQCQYCQLRFTTVQDCSEHLFAEHQLKSKQEFQRSKRSCPHRCGFYSENLTLKDLIEHLKAKHSFSDRIVTQVKHIQRKKTTLGSEAEVKQIPMCFMVQEKEARTVLKPGRREIYNQYFCSFEDCGYGAPNKELMERHTRIHHPVDEFGNRKPFPCLFNDCQLTFLSKKLLEKHLYEDSHLKNNYCKVCERQFRDRENAKHHFRFRHRIMDMSCTIEGCEFRAKLLRDLKNHQRHVHSSGSVQCPIEGCKAVFQKKWLITRHIARVHENQPNEKCFWPGCGEAFFSNFSLLEHTRVHVNRKRYRCKWPDCSYASVQHYIVQKHVRVCHLKIPHTRIAQRQQKISNELYEKANDFVETLPIDVQI